MRREASVVFRCVHGQSGSSACVEVDGVLVPFWRVVNGKPAAIQALYCSVKRFFREATVRRQDTHLAGSPMPNTAAAGS